MRAVCDLLESYFRDAAQELGPSRQTFRIAGRAVRLRFAGDRFREPLTRALQHLRSEDGDAELEVRIWDGSVPPRHHVLRAYLFALSNWWFDYVDPRGRLRDVHSEALVALYEPVAGTLSAVDRERNVAFYWKRDAEPLPPWDLCAPLRPLLHAWLRGRGLQLVHGAAVGDERGGLLLVGPGGSGKSTSALACLDSELGYLGDDYCVVGRDAEGGYRAHSLYSSAKLAGGEDLAHFPALAGHVANPEREPGEKAALFLHEKRPEKLVRELPVRALLVPEIAGRTALEPCDARRALRALAPPTLAQLPASGSEDLRFLGAMVRGLPRYRLRLGPDRDAIPAVLRDLLDAESPERPLRRRRVS